jgi:DnaJ domain
MYIVWHQKAIKSDHKVELFTTYYNFQPRRYKVPRSDQPAWKAKPIYCTHRGPGRIAWIPALVHAERIDGKPRQKLLRRLPGIRSCCIDDRFIRAAWWQAIDDMVRFWREDADGEEAQFFARDWKAMLAKLREVVPRPTRAGLREFMVYCRELEAEEKRAQAEEQRRQAEEQKRRVDQETRQRLEDLLRRMRANLAPAPCWAVLGLSPPPATTMEMLKKRYRELAKQHHPDRNSGKDDMFKRVEAAHEQAKKILGGV